MIDLAKHNKSTTSSSQTSLEQIVDILVGGLKLPYRNAWDSIMLVYQDLYLVLGENSSPLLDGLTVSLSNIHKQYETKNNTLDKAIEDALVIAIGSMGPRKFLTLLPLNLLPE